MGRGWSARNHGPAVPDLCLAVSLEYSRSHTQREAVWIDWTSGTWMYLGTLQLQVTDIHKYPGWRHRNKTLRKKFGDW